MDKQCFKCGQVKPLEEYYKHPQMLDGHLNKCKACAKKDVTDNRWSRIEGIREYDRERGKLDHRIANTVEQSKKWYAKDKRRLAAHNALHRAVKKGIIVRQSCERCGAEKSVAHHEDYDKPLDVVWLCQPCHKQRHKEIDAERAGE